MGYEADRMIGNFISGRWGIPLGKRSTKVHARTTRSAIAHQLFSIVEVTGLATNRIQGTKLIVCDQDEQTYWVWASSGVTGIRKSVCTVLHADLPLADALQRLKRKPYRAGLPAAPAAKGDAPALASQHLPDRSTKLPEEYKPKTYGRAPDSNLTSAPAAISSAAEDTPEPAVLPVRKARPR